MSVAISPKVDRLPLRKKIHLLSDRGLWPQLERLVKAYGWEGEQTMLFIDSNLPKACCANDDCTEQFYMYSKRVKYCSDKCRRQAAAKPKGGVERPTAPQLEQPIITSVQVGELCIKLVRSGAEGKTTRFYTLMVVQDLFGNVTLNRRWGRDEQDQAQRRSEACVSLAEAVEHFNRLKESCLKRGYTIVDEGA